MASLFFSYRATNFLYLNSTLAATPATNRWNDTTPTSTVFTVGDSLGVNRSSGNFIAYCFHSVDGYQSVGSYTGTGASGNSVTTGFEPSFVMIKRTDSAGGWRMIDNKRFSGSNKNSLQAQSSTAEQVGYIDIDFNATNFTINSTNVDFNASGGTYIYLAIKAN